MNKLTIHEIEAVVKNDCSDLIEQIRDLSRKMKDCRESLVHNKKVLELEIGQLNYNLNSFKDYVSGKILQDISVLNYAKIRIGDLEQSIFGTRERIRKLTKSLYDLRQQNNKLFKKLLVIAIIQKAANTTNDESVSRNKKIVLNNSQARQVFNTLYDVLESGKDFKQVTINIG